jgi:superfamily II DNA/RNA helicase
MPPEIERFVNTFLHTPERVEVARASSTSETITQVLLPAPSVAAGKRETLRTAINGASDLTNGIIFCNRKRDVSVVERSLKRHGYNAGCLHGDMDQRARMQTLDAFRNNELTLLVASDVAARGLDIPAVSHVFNFDVPTHAEDYVHRIGRTGRAGREGTAITLASKSDGKYVSAIEAMIGQPIPRAEEPEQQDEEKTTDAATSETTDKGPDEAAAKPSRSRGRRGGRGSRGGADKAAKATPAVEDNADDQLAVASTAPAEAKDAPSSKGVAKSEETGRTPSQKRGRGRRGGRNDQDGPDDRRPFGETDYVPAFLLRPIKRAVA